MYVLGLESTAHTFGVGITDGKDILSNVRDTYLPERGGIIPSKAAEHHYSLASKLIEKALSESGLKLKDIDVIAFSQGPGIFAPLKVSFQVAKYISEKFNKKMIGVNHCIAHLEIARKFTGFQDPVMLYVSGGNTQVITFEDGYYRIFGETQDIGVGNLLDKVGRLFEIKFPAGPEIERIAKRGKRYIEMPYSIKGMDVSLSGIETFIKRIKNSYRIEDILFSLQETVFSMLIEASERAIAYCGKDSFVITGGVAANKRLNEMGEKMCEERKTKFKSIPMEYAGDNGAMIAYTGFLMKDYQQNDLKPKTNFRTDEVKIEYR